MRNLLAAEVLKLQTVKMTWLFLIATVVISGLAVAGAIVGADSTTLDLESERGVRTILSVAATGAILVLILGTIISSGEYRQRTATETFLTTPRRWRVITAKLSVATVVGAVFGALSAGVALGVAAEVYWLKDLTFPLDSADIWNTLSGAVLFAALYGGLGAATGSLVRNQVTAIVGWLVWIAVVEHIAVQILPSVGRWLPTATGRALMRAPSGDLLSPQTAALALALYGVVVMGIAIVSEHYRDA